MNEKAIFEYTDAAKWGVSDFYDNAADDLRKAIKALLSKGEAFTTGWYGVKKEIQSGNITFGADKKGLVEVSVSDDFDTPGHGEFDLDFSIYLDSDEAVEHCYEQIIYYLDEAADLAEKDRKQNELYCGFKIGKHGQGKFSSWIYTYIAPYGDGAMMDEPPGDNYYAWGWQEDTEDLPEACKEWFQEFINDAIYDDSKVRMVCGEWMIQAWGRND